MGNCTIGSDTIRGPHYGTKKYVDFAIHPLSTISSNTLYRRRDGRRSNTGTSHAVNMVECSIDICVSIGSADIDTIRNFQKYKHTKTYRAIS